MEIFIFSHDQFHFDFASFHRKWARVFSVVSAIVLVGQGTLYAMLYLGADALSENNITAILTWTVAILSLALPFCFLLAFFYFATVALSGFPYLSALAHARVSKINLVFVVWTVGRLVRGTLLMLSLRFDWESSLPEAYLAALIVAILVVVEIIPFYLSLDWSTVAILITDMNDERRQQLLNAPHGIMFSPDASAHDAHEQRDPEVRRLFLDPNSVVPVGDADEGGEGDLDDGAAADSASSSSSVLFHARHTASGGGGAVAIVVRKFQLHELDSASMCDEYAQDLALWSNVDHPHVARFVGVYRIGLSVYSCTEAHGVPLDRLIARAPKQPMPAPKLIRLAKQVCRALSFLQLRRRTQGASGGSGGNSIGVGHGQLSSSSVVVRSVCVFREHGAGAWLSFFGVKLLPRVSIAAFYCFALRVPD